MGNEFAPKTKKITIKDTGTHDVEITINDLIKQDAIFYLNDKKISNSKARELFRKTEALATIDVSIGVN